MGYRILVADDEELIRKGLIARLRHLGYEPEALYEASDGAEALSVLRRESPEIVITDIRMPAMEGLEFIRDARELSPLTEFVILSGHAEFTYAEQAIKLGVHAYLVKPLSNEELGRVMQELLEKLDRKRRMSDAMAALDGRRSLLLERQLVGLLSGDDNPPEEPLASFLGDGSHYAVAALLAERREEEDGGNTVKLREAVRRCFGQLEDGRSLLAADPSDPLQFFLLRRGPSPDAVLRDLEDQAARLCRLAALAAEVSAVIGISDAGEAPSAVLAEQSLEALCLRITNGGGPLFRHRDIPALSGEQLPGELWGQFRRSVERRDLGKAEEHLRKLLGEARRQKRSPAYLRLLWMRVLHLLLAESPPADQIMLNQAALNTARMKRFTSVEDMGRALYGLVANVIGSGSLEELDSASKVRLAAQHIAENYRQDLTVNDMAELFGLSPNYFSTVFRRETGATVVNFIKNIRLEKACELLRSTDESVAEIAGRTGYHDSQYFFRVFKKELGVPPLQYRRDSRVRVRGFSPAGVMIPTTRQ